ncbi:MAG: excinuclease ABC subunit UvrC [Bernardetiaceae bacterium]|nr:excinuclease ABC subunit UvrC [Bernardetiaceae bacterium]
MLSAYETELKEKIRNLPIQPGVYRYLDEQGKVIYVGKAKHLKKRVSSYFTKSHTKDRKTRQLVREIADLSVTVVNTEVDALLLENNLIKTHQPKYNILLKDGKSYPYICITNEPFPQVYSTRNPIKGKGEFYGPYTSGRTLNALMELVRKLYTIRTCTHHLSQSNVENGKFKVCLEYHIKNCKGPCVGLQSEQDYDKDISQIRHILKGKLGVAKQYFKEKMKIAAQNLQFELAQRFKEKLNALDDYQSKSMVTNPSVSDVEVFTIISDEANAYVNYLRIEDGGIVYAENDAYRKKLEETDAEILDLVVIDFRNRYNSTAKRIISNIDLDISLPDVEWHVPKIGDLKRLEELSLKNVTLFKKEKLRKKEAFAQKKQEQNVVALLQKDLGLKELPLHIECFDNSNLHGTNPVSSMVCFLNGKPSKRNYRKFHIKTVEGIDDFASMYEVVYRRYRRLLEERSPLPNLVIVDGGKGQLSASVKALKDLDIYGKMTIVGIAKRLEEIYFPGDSEPHYISKKSPSLRLIQHLRNEAHRFAITFHRDMRSKNALKNSLEDINGIGAKTAEKLLLHFRSIDKIKQANEKEIARVVGVAKAKIVQHALKEGS